MDPLLSGGTDHARQESGDSGLSLSSNNYSMSHTPDYLSAMDDSMDCISGNYIINYIQSFDEIEFNIVIHLFINIIIYKYM